MNIEVSNRDLAGDEAIAKNWVERCGTKDGAVLAQRVIDELQDDDTEERVAAISEVTVTAIRQLAATYQEHGVSDALIGVWRAACHGEMERVFREARAGMPEAMDSGPLIGVAQGDGVAPRGQ